jgi:uncharacterized protein (TIGR03086 family)
VTLPSDTAWLDGLDCFGAVVNAVPLGRWDAPSPCQGWTILDVLGHLGSSIAFGVSVLEDRLHEWPTLDRPADLVEGEPADYWFGVAASARAAVAGVDLEDTRQTPMGRRTVGQSLAFPTIDCCVHAWDIGHAVGIDVEVPDDAIAYTHHYLDPMPQDRMRGPGGAFGPELLPPADATPTEALMAWTGRATR